MAGRPYAAQTADGTSLAGTVHTWQPPFLFAGTVEGLGDGLLRLELERRSDPSRVNLWLSSYGVAEQRLRGLEAA